MAEKIIRPVADIIIEKTEKIILIQRASEPFKNHWCLPGGHVDYGETVEEAAVREAREETGLDVKLLEMLGAYSDPKRDPRYQTVSIVFIAKPLTNKLKADTDTKDVKWIRLSDINLRNLAFDHAKIIKDYIKWKKKKGTFWSGK